MKQGNDKKKKENKKNMLYNESRWSKVRGSLSSGNTASYIHANQDPDNEMYSV